MGILFLIALLGSPPEASVRFGFAKIGEVPFADISGHPRASSEPYLSIAVLIENQSDKKKLDYRGAGAVGLF